MKYVVVGGLSIDHVISASGEKRLDQFGGNAAYGAAGARIWAAGNVGMAARRGGDFPSAWLDAAGAAGIDAAGVTRVPAPHGLHGGMVYDGRGDRDNYLSRDDIAAAAGRGEKSDMSSLVLHRAQMDFGADASDIPEKYGDAEAVLLAPRYLKKQMSCIRRYRDGGRSPLIILDPMHTSMQLERSDELRAAFSQVDALLPSEAEMTALFGPVAPEEGARLFAEMGAPVVVIKLGTEGCLVHAASSGLMRRVPILPVTARDPTGAGDSFCGGFLVGMRETGDPVRAAQYGTVSSSFIVEGFGADFTYSVTRSEAEKRLSELTSIQGAEKC